MESPAFHDSFSDKGYTHTKGSNEGVGMYAKASGQRNSSTRMETVGALVAITRMKPLDLYSDSASMIGKMRNMIEVTNRGGGKQATRIL